MDLGGWLRSLGLEQYEAAFRENEIDDTVLRNLTQEDLKEIGVGPVGHRRKLLDAVAALRADAGGKAPAADAASSKEKWCEADIHRIAGEIALLSPQPDAAMAEAHFERALAVARAQRAKSWELRAAMSMARLWRDQGNRDEARDLLAPVYGWFTEGFDTLDLKEAKALLEQLMA